MLEGCTGLAEEEVAEGPPLVADGPTPVKDSDAAVVVGLLTVVFCR